MVASEMHSVPVQPPTAPPAPAKATLVPVIAILAFGCFVVLTSVTLLSRWLHAPIVGTCTTPGCIEHAKALKDAMNSSVQPCSDFYSFSCGSWKPAGSQRSMIEQIFARSFDIAVQQLERKASDSDLPIAQLYFQSCLAEHSDTSLKEEVRKFAQFKRDLGLLWPEEWPENSNVSVPPLKVLINLTVNWNVNLIFNIRAMPGYKGRPRALFIQQGLLNPKWALETADEMTRSVTKHLEYLEAPAPTPEQLTQIRDAYLAVVNATLSFTPDARDEKRRTLKEIDERTEFKKDKWLLYVNEMFFPDLAWRPEDVVLVQHSDILDNVEHLLESMDDESLRLGIAWALLRMTLWTIVGKPRLRYEGTDVELAEKRKTACLAQVAAMFGLAISTRHLHVRFREQVRGYLESVFKNVKTQYQKGFAGATWIEDSVKTKLKAKMSEDLDLDSLPGSQFFSNFTIGQLYKDFPKSTESFFDNFINIAKAFRKKVNSDDFVTTFSKSLGDGHVATSYSYYYNSVHFAVGALEPPLFHAEGSFAITYGSLGTLLASSMARAFDDRGIMYDKGEESPWWSSGGDAYKKRVECGLKAGASRPGQDAARSSPLWLLVLGLRTSYAAFREAVKGERTVDVFRLEGLEKYSDDQVFFMTYCLMTCAVGSNGDDCNVPVRQSRKFAYAFKCADKTPMNPKERCPFF
ncbi:endothelin-converting enzyme 2-like [Dermacentor variabilis]|uniref:endothelin-converting enzyme 2-like n=1 Tax=Dermacentor variabilis TaxID=34621 RepID=UPI003F5B1EFF